MNITITHDVYTKQGFYKSVDFKTYKKLSSEIYHRENDPAIIILHRKGNFYHKMVLMWYLNGKLHRTDGPAIITNSTMILQKEENSEHYYLNGQNLKKSDWEKQIRKYKLLKIMNNV